MRISRRVAAAPATAIVVAMALAGCSGSTSDTDAVPTSTIATVADGTTYIAQVVSDGQTEFTQVLNPNGGQTLSFSTEGGMPLIEVSDGEYTYAFKDMNGNGELDVYEDWREEPATRAADIATQLTKEQQAGLMLFSAHERAPGDGLTEAQKEYLSESHVRAVLNAGTSEAKQNVQWVNAMQAYVETLANDELPYIPVNYSTDPRSDASGTGLFSETGDISLWPSSLGLAATFDSDTVRTFAQNVSLEYKALGIGTALSPQIDLASDPRWSRNSGTFGEDSTMAGEMAAAYVAGMQNTYGDNGESLGWGSDSVAAMIKHWPGDGAGEGGRESHYDRGKYEVFPGGNQAEHISVFQQALESASVMTDYSIITDGEGNALYDNLMGTSYDPERLRILREDNGYEGVVVTDWMVTKTADEIDTSGPPIATAWGAEDLSVEERHFQIIKNGTDMFGGNNDVAPVLAAYEMWDAEYEAGNLDVDAATRWAESAQRILTMSFANGGFDNPFLVLDNSVAAVGSEDKVLAGQEAQLNSIVTLKNDSAISLDENAYYSDKTVYVPQSYDVAVSGSFSSDEPESAISIDQEVLEKYFGTVLTDEVTDNGDGTFTYTAPDLSNVDLVLVGMDSPSNNGGQRTNDDGSTTFVPISLQYRPYTADGDNVREVSIAGDVLADGTKENRSYKGETSEVSNEADLDALLRARDAVDASGRDIPVVAVLRASNPTIPAEFEASADAILVGFGTADEALVRVALGLHESNGRLPMQFPADMDTVEASQEDVPKDVTPYTDSLGNTYDYGFGLHLDGTVITD